MHAKLVPVVSAAVAAAAVMTGQASAAAAPHGGKVTAARPGVSRVLAVGSLPGLRPSLASVLKSPDLAGYAVTPTKLISATATIKIPSVTCARSGNSGIAPGVYLYGGYGGYSGAWATAFCENGQARYEASVTINGTQSNVFTVKPGNTVIVSISETVSKTSAKVRDVTTGAHKSLSGAGSDKTQVLIGDGGVFFGGLGLDDLAGVPKFSSYPLTLVSVGGKALGSVHPVDVERVKGSTLQLLPSAITGGKTFKVEFKHT